MYISDYRFNSVSDFSEGLIKELRTLVAHADGLDPEDCLIFCIEHLMQVQIVLRREGLINKLADPDEALQWKSEFLRRVEDCERMDESTNLIQQFVSVFDSYIDVCNSD